VSVVARQPDTLGIAVGAGTTFFVHAAFIGLFLLANVFGDEEAESQTLVPVISAELLMFGDVMPNPGELPWIANPEEAPQDDRNPEPAPVPETETALPDQEVVVLNQEPVPQQERRREENRARPEESPRDAPERRDRGETNPNRPTNTRPRVGSPDGFVGGTSLSAEAQANQFAELVRQLSRALRKPAALSDAEYRRLSADVRVRVTADGRVTSWDFVGRSGNGAFDDAVESMLGRFKLGTDRLRIASITNAELREAVIRQGFQIPVRGGI
jgi:outer membrane biosynthesis protein TonB